MEQISIGDRVTVVREYRHGAGAADGMTGRLVRIDPGDSDYPYLVEVAGDEVWVHEIQEAPNSGTDERESLVTRAKELLVGTDHTGADVVAMAAFLAGG